MFSLFGNQHNYPVLTSLGDSPYLGSAPYSVCTHLLD